MFLCNLFANTFLIFTTSFDNCVLNATRTKNLRAKLQEILSIQYMLGLNSYVKSLSLVHESENDQGPCASHRSGNLSRANLVGAST